jgi:uncharacterized OB-fold protein
LHVDKRESNIQTVVLDQCVKDIVTFRVRCYARTVYIDHDSAPFWAALRERRLVVQRCASCLTPRWPFRTVCAVCCARGWAEQTTSGTGAVYSWIAIHHATVPTPPSLLPYRVALVALDEDSRILIPGQYDGPGDELHTGLRVVAAFHDTTDDITVMHWRRQTAVSGEEG